jgi:hypothetical protein
VFDDVSSTVKHYGTSALFRGAPNFINPNIPLRDTSAGGVKE